MLIANSARQKTNLISDDLEGSRCSSATQPSTEPIAYPENVYLCSIWS